MSENTKKPVMTVKDFLARHPNMAWVAEVLEQIGPLKPCPFCGGEALLF